MFADLHDRMTAAGVTVGVELRDGVLAILLDDPSTARSIRYEVAHGIDRAAAALILSGRLRQVLGLRHGQGRHCCARGSWPEFVELWSTDEVLTRRV